MQNMMKKLLKNGYTGLFTALLSACVGVEGRMASAPTQPTVLPVKQAEITPIQPIQKTPTPTITTSPTKNDPEVLNINKTVKIVASQQGCDASQWNNPEDACQCCLTYGKGKFGKEQSADQIIDHCMNKSKQCNSSSLGNIKRKHKAQTMSSDEFLNTLYSDTTVVYKMAVNPTLIKSDGILTENGLATLLFQAYAEGKLKDQAFKNKECLTVTSLGSGSGLATLQLFKVSSTCASSTLPAIYFIKESNTGLTESIHLKVIEEYPGMKELMTPNVVKDLPSLALPFFYFSYHPLQQKIHYIATMPAAKGEVLCKIITQFRDNQSVDNKNRLEKAYEVLGKELSNFYKRFMTPTPNRIIGKTVAHGDFHCNNIFYDEKKEHCTFIDNETMIRSFKKRKSPKADFMRLLFPSFAKTESIFKELITGIEPGTYFNLTLKPFLRGYISTYNPKDKKRVLQELKAMLTHKIDVTFLDFDRDYIHKLIAQHVIPIFNEVAKTLK